LSSFRFAMWVPPVTQQKVTKDNETV
jgi:hypothetical protein